MFIVIVTVTVAGNVVVLTVLPMLVLLFLFLLCIQSFAACAVGQFCADEADGLQETTLLVLWQVDQ